MKTNHTIKSADDPDANFDAIRKRLVAKGKHGMYRCRTYGFIEVSLEDLVAHGCRRAGRNYILIEAGMGVHEVADANHYHSKTPDRKTRKENYKKAKGHIGCNCNASATAKALASSVFLKLGIRHRLSRRDDLIVDTWPDYEEAIKYLNENDCGYMLS